MLVEKYWTNPQYLVRLNFIDDGDDEKLCTMIIALMQKETRQRRLHGLEAEDYIQFRVFKVNYREKEKFARDGDRTHAHYCELDLKSNALTTRPPWLDLSRGHSKIFLN